MMTTVRITIEYDGKAIHTRQVTITKTLADGLTEPFAKQVDMMADTVLKADKMGR